MIWPMSRVWHDTPVKKLPVLKGIAPPKVMELRRAAMQISPNGTKLTFPEEVPLAGLHRVISGPLKHLSPKLSGIGSFVPQMPGAMRSRE